MKKYNKIKKNKQQLIQNILSLYLSLKMKDFWPMYK